ncbi:hypothetical protein MHK_005747, partial [Candidatus Magnetomorum sp. HK-1]
KKVIMSKKIKYINNMINSMLEEKNWEDTLKYKDIELFFQQQSELNIKLEKNFEHIIAFWVDISLNLSSIMQGKRKDFWIQSACALFMVRGPVYKYGLSAHVNKIIDQITKTLNHRGALQEAHLIYVIDDHIDVKDFLHDTFPNIFVSNRDGLKSMMLSSNPQEHIHDRLRTKKINLSCCPYNYLGPTDPKLFVGRTELRQEIIYSESVYAFAIAGGRKIGKSSLLFKVMEEMNSPKYQGSFHPIYIDCSGSASYDALMDEIYRKLNPDFRTMLDGNFETLLSRGFKGKPIMLLLDEMDALIQNVRSSGEDSPKFEFAIRTVANKKRAKVVICGNREIFELITDASHPYYNLFERKQLGVLCLEEVRPLLTLPFLALDFDIENRQSLVEKIFEKTSGHPSAVQFIARSLFEVSDKKMIYLNDLNIVLE